VTGVVDEISKRFTSNGQPNAEDVVAVGLTVAEAVASLVTLLTLVFFWMTEHARLQRYALAFVSLERRAGMRQAWDEVEDRLGLWVRGQLILMGSMALATGAVYTVMGLPSALLLGLIAGFAEAIPLVGPLLGAIPAVVVAATVDPQLVLFVVLAYIVIQFIEGNVLVPMVMRNTIRLSSFLVIASLLVGGAVAGLVGAFLAVPMVAAVEVILERFQAREVPVTQAPGGVQTDEDSTDEPVHPGGTAVVDRPLDSSEGVPATGS
jgi:predicted PurR-regulated permease PerM